MKTAIGAALVTLVLAAIVNGDEKVAGFHEATAATYNFRPRDLDEAKMNAKSEDLDRYWQTAKALGPSGIELVRAELRRPDASPFFYYDGSKLLLSLSSTPADLKLAATVIARSDIGDLQPDDYFFTVHGLAVRGQDVTAAAFSILADPNFKVIVPQHALTLDQMSCLMYMFLPMSDAVYVAPAIWRLAVETDVAAQKSLLQVLVYAVNAEADAAIARFAADQTKPAVTRAIAAGLVKRLRPGGSGASKSGFLALARRRHEELKNVSDEAIIEIQRLTAEMRRAQSL
jgi:hypothetical protein